MKWSDLEYREHLGRVVHVKRMDLGAPCWDWILVAPGIAVMLTKYSDEVMDLKWWEVQIDPRHERLHWGDECET